jgi:uncharacterized LabA/DUF88 family protein
MKFYPSERTALFIDGANLYATARAAHVDIDYKLLLKSFTDNCMLMRAFYYTATFEDQEYSPLRPLIDWLDYNGYRVVTKPVKEFVDEQGRRKIKGNMDIEIAVDMLDLSQHIDHAVLFSGDGDFRKLVETLQRKGLRVTVISSNKTNPSMIADELRRQADQFIELTKLNELLSPDGKDKGPISPSSAKTTPDNDTPKSSDDDFKKAEHIDGDDVDEVDNEGEREDDDIDGNTA